MKEIHPLKRKSVKPSSSTVRGMLPSKQFRALDSALQGLRATGLRFDWIWKEAEIGWVCAGLYEDRTYCELVPSQSPLVGQIRLSQKDWKNALESEEVPERYKAILKLPIEKDRKEVLFEFELESTAQRDMFSEIVENLMSALSGNPV